MLESFTIFNKSGVILYQYTANPSLVQAEDPVANAIEGINTIISKIILDPSTHNKTYHIIEGLTFCWNDDGDKYGLATYPDIFFEGPRQFLKEWAERLISQALQEYKLYHTNAKGFQIRPDPKPFDQTFQVLLNTSKGDQMPKPTTNTQKKEETNKQNDNNKGKEKRQWHDGKAKVTEKAMKDLDMSKDAGSPEDATERALQEARQAYLPTDFDLKEEVDTLVDDDEKTMFSSVTSVLQQLTGNKVLSDSDLDKPLKQMEEALTSKNVASEVAHELCEGVRSKLKGKKLNSLYRVQTAVRQALEDTLTKMLHTDVDLLRSISSKRGDGSLFKITKRTPYVVAVCGINGVGKSTSLAKLAYHFKMNGCSPLLVAGDTFRSGAVEQLKVHAQCLEVPIFAQGYSKDPSAVAKAAIQQATENGNDVVLIDTAGRMQNNVPLMKALGKLVQENQPDFVILVCEALVGHDGLSQFRMFRDALGKRGIDGLVLTKFDTVSDKVGAALTLTHQTGSPIVFCGTGQKYHHLKKLSVPTIIKSLFS